MASDETAARPAYWRDFPAHLLVERQEVEERGIFVYHEDIGWWEFVETFTDPVRAQERLKEYADRGERAALAKRNVVRYPWSIVCLLEARSK